MSSNRPSYMVTAKPSTWIERLARLGYITKGFVYGLIGVLAIMAAFGLGGQTTDTTGALQTIATQPFGQFLKAYKTKFTQQLNLSNLESKKQNFLINICRLGIVARGFVFVIIGFFLIQAARFTNPNEVKGIDGVLQTLRQQPFGKLLLTLVALGLVAYGIYIAVKAIYKRIEVH